MVTPLSDPASIAAGVDTLAFNLITGAFQAAVARGSVQRVVIDVSVGSFKVRNGAAVARFLQRTIEVLLYRPFADESLPIIDAVFEAYAPAANWRWSDSFLFSSSPIDLPMNVAI